MQGIILRQTMQWYVNRETITQHYNEQRDLGAKLLSSVCSDVDIEPIHRDILGEQLSRAFNRTPDARLDIHTGGFRKRQCAAFFDMRVRHSNASSCQNKEPQQVSQIHENEKKRQYSRRILDVEKGTLTLLVFTTSSAMGIDWQSSFPQRKKSNIPQPSPR